MPPKKKSEVKEITKIANSSVESYFNTAARRKAVQNDPNKAITEGGRGTSRKKAKITTTDAVEWSNRQRQTTTTTTKKEDRLDETTDDFALMEEDDDEWETVVVNTSTTNVKKEEEAKVKKEEVVLQQQQQQASNSLLNEDAAAATGNNDNLVLNPDDLGVARALQKERQKNSRERVIMSCCSLIVFRIAQGRWMRDRVAANGKLALALRRHPRFIECFAKIDEIFSSSSNDLKFFSNERNIATSIAKHVDRLRPTWLSLKPSVVVDDKNKKKTSNEDDAAATNNNNNNTSRISQALQVIADTMASIFELELPTPSLHPRKGDDHNSSSSDTDTDDDEDPNQNTMMMMMMPPQPTKKTTKNNKTKKKKKTSDSDKKLDNLRKSAKRFCDLNDILHIPPPLLLAPVVQSAVKAGKNQFRFDENGDDDDEQQQTSILQQDSASSKKNPKQSSSSSSSPFVGSTSQNKVMHSCWWTLLFAAICNASRHLSDFRTCVSFDLFVCHQLEKARFGQYSSGAGAFGRWTTQADAKTKKEEDYKKNVKKEEADLKVKKEEARDRSEDEELIIVEDDDENTDKTKEEKKHYKPQQTVWVELWNPERDCYVPVSTPMIFRPAQQQQSTRSDAKEETKQKQKKSNTAKKQKELEKEQQLLNDLVGGPRWNSPYVLAFGRDGTVIDVSAKYSNSWSKIFPMRLDYMMRNHHQGELDATKEVDPKYTFTTTTTSNDAASENKTNSILPSPTDIISAINSNTRTLAPLIRNCEYLLPPNASWSDHLLSKLNKNKVRSLDLTYKLIRDRLQLHLLKYGGDPVPKTLVGIKQHPLYICDTQIARHETIYPRDGSTTVGLFRGAPVYRRTAVRPLRGVEGWLRLKRMIIDAENVQPAKTCPPPASRPLARHSRLFGIWQTVPYQPLPLREEINIDDDSSSISSSSGSDDDDDDDDDDKSSSDTNGVRYVIPTLNSYLDWYIILKGYKLPEGISHFPQQGIRGVARKMHIDFATAVVGFKKQEDPLENNNANTFTGTSSSVKIRSTRQQDPNSNNNNNNADAAEQFKRSRLQNIQRKPWKAVFDGVVVKTADAQRLKTAYDEFLRVKELKEKARRRARALQWWNVLITRRLAMDRLANAL